MGIFCGKLIMKLAASLIIYSAHAGLTNDRECQDMAENEHCTERCVNTYANCARYCDGDLNCIQDCGRTQAVCESQCPCGSSCPGGCPCGYSTPFCNKCEREECLAFTDAVLDMMDLEADPCQNFDQYVCGSWKETAEIPADRGSYSQFAVVRKDLSATLKRVLENSDETTGANSWDSVKKSKRFYNNCMDMDTINAMSNEQLEAEVTIAWPTMQRPEDNQSVYNSIVQALTKYSTSAIFSADQDLDNEDSNKWIIDLGHPGLGMSQTYYTTEDAEDAKKYKDAYVD